MDRGDMSPDSYDYEGAGEDDLYSNDDSKSTLSIPSLSSQREQRGSHSRPHGHEQAIAQMKESLSHLGEGTQMRRSSNAVSSPVGPSFDDLMSELSELYTKLEAKDKDLVMAGEMGSMLLEKNEEANARVEELTVQVEELQEETDKLKNAVRGEERKNARLHKQLEEHEHREKELSDAVENLRAELATEREKGKGRKETQAKTEELSDELSGRIRDLESKLARQIAEYTKLSKEHAATQEAIDELKDQLTDAQQEIAKGKKIATQYQQAVAEIEKLKADNKTNQLSALQFENSHLTETVMGLTQELQKYQQVYEENKHLYQVAQQKIEQLTNDNAALKKKLTLNVPSPKALGPRKTSFVSLADDLEEDETSKPTTPKVDTRAVTFPLPSPTTEPTSTPETVTTPPVAAAATTPKAAPTEPPKPTPVETSAPPVVPSIPLPSSSPMSIITGALASSPQRTSVTDAFKATSPIEASIFDVDQKRAVEPTPAPAQVSTIDPSRSMHAMQQREKEQKRQLESTLNNPLQQQPIIASPPQQQQRPFIPTYTIASPPPAALQQQQQPTQTPPQTARSGWFSSITSRITGKSSTPVSQPGSARQLATTSVGYGASPLHIMPGDPDYIPPVSGLHEYGRSVKPATDERALWEFFSLSVLSIKLNAGAGKDVELLYSINAKELWEKAKKENLQFHQYHDWLKIEINKSYYHKLYKSGGTGIPMHGGGYAPPQARPAVNVAGIPAAYQQRTTPLSFSALVFGRTQPAPNPVPPTPATPPISQHLHSASSYGSAASSSSVHTASPQPSRTSTSQKSASPGLTASSHGTYSNQASLSQSLLDADDDEHTIQERLKAVPLDPHEISQLR